MSDIFFSFPRPWEERSTDLFLDQPDTRQFFRIHQGQRSISDYAIEFRTLAASAGWGEQELHGAYFNGLSERLLDELSTCELPTSLDALIDLTLRIDTRLADRQAARRTRDPVRPRDFPRTGTPTTFHPGELPEPEPMQVGHARLSFDERQRRRDRHLCLYCGDSGHLIAKCPLKGKCPSVSEGILTGATFEPHPPTSQSSLSARINLAENPAPGSQYCWTRGRMPASSVPPWSREWASPRFHSPHPCVLVLSRELNCQKFRGLPSRSRLAFWGTTRRRWSSWFCSLHGFRWYWANYGLENITLKWIGSGGSSQDRIRSAIPLVSDPPPSLRLHQTPPHTHPPDLSSIPKEYHDLGEVFSKSKATSLPPHRSYDCSIDLLSGTSPPRGRLFSLPRPTPVSSWPIPTSRKDLQRFLGFANFYRRFIRNFSSIVSPLTKLTSIKKPFQWSAEAESAFQTLKDRFSTAPILIMPDPEKQFVVEVDASDTGAGAVLSQRSSDGKIHPCTYFSHRLSPTERNYAVGDRELLALKMALEEWRHLLEGSTVPFFSLDWSQKSRILTHG